MSEPRLRQAADVFVQDVDGEFLVMREGSSDVLHLDPVASDVWRALHAAPTRQGLIDELTAVYGIERRRAAADLEPLLNLLLSHGLVIEEVPH